MENYKFVSKNVKKDITLRTSSRLYGTRPLFSYGYFYRLDYLLNIYRDIKMKEKNNYKVEVLFKNYDDDKLRELWIQKYKDIKKNTRVNLHLWQILQSSKELLHPNKIKVMCHHSLVDTISAFRKINYKLNKDVYNSKSSDTDLYVNLESMPIQVLVFFLQNFSTVFSKNPIIIMKIPYLFYHLDIKVVYIFTLFFESCRILKPRFLEVGSQDMYMVLSKPKKMPRNIKSVFKETIPDSKERASAINDIYMNTTISEDFKAFLLKINIESQLSDMKDLFHVFSIINKNLYFGEKYESYLTFRKQNAETIVSGL